MSLEIVLIPGMEDFRYRFCLQIQFYWNLFYIPSPFLFVHSLQMNVVSQIASSYQPRCARRSGKISLADQPEWNESPLCNNSLLEMFPQYLGSFDQGFLTCHTVHTIIDSNGHMLLLLIVVLFSWTVCLGHLPY